MNRNKTQLKFYLENALKKAKNQSRAQMANGNIKNEIHGIFTNINIITKSTVSNTVNLGGDRRIPKVKVRMNAHKGRRNLTMLRPRKWEQK